MSAERPHTAVISIQLEVHPLRETGECDSKVVAQDYLKEEYGIDSNMLINISGYNMADCLTKLRDKLEALKDG
jgi:hypothetical protein